MSTVMSLAFTAFYCAMFWQLLGGIADFAQSRDRPDLVSRATNRRLGYVAYMLFGTLLRYGMDGPGGTGAVGVILAITMIVLIIMILHLIYRVRKELVLEQGEPVKLS